MKTTKLMKRRDIYKDELIELCDRQGLFVHTMRYNDIKIHLSVMGNCECGCGKAFNGDMELDHVIPNAMLYEGDEVKWQALLPACHRLKTDDDVARIAKAKSQGGETGQQARRRKNGPKMRGGQGFQKPPPDYKHNWGKGQKMPSRKLKSRNDLKRRD